MSFGTDTIIIVQFYLLIRQKTTKFTLLFPIKVIYLCKFCLTEKYCKKLKIVTNTTSKGTIIEYNEADGSKKVLYWNGNVSYIKVKDVYE